MISVIVPTYDGRRWLELCLPALLVQQVAVEMEIIVVDDGSRDGSVAFLVEAFPQVRVVESRTCRGFAAACNLGAAHARGDLLAFLNNDTRPHALWLARLAEALRLRSDAGLAASMILCLGNRTVDSAGDGYLRCGGAFKYRHGEPTRADDRGGSRAGADAGAGADARTDATAATDAATDATVGAIAGATAGAEASPAIREVFGACGAAFMIRRPLFEALGGFDEDFGMVHEDVDLSYRARLLGAACILVPDAIVEHAGSASLGRLSARAVFLGQRNLEWTYLKNTPLSLLWRTLPSHVLYGMAAGVGFGLTGHGWTFVRAKLSACAGLPGLLRKRRLTQRGRRASTRALVAHMEREWIARKWREKRFTRTRDDDVSAHESQA